MVDRDLLQERLKLLGEYISDLQSVQEIDWTTFQENKVLRRFIERTLHVAIEACLDVGSHIIASEGLGEPRRNRDVFAILGEAGWIEPAHTERLIQMAGFRNILVHDYAEIDERIVYDVLKQHLGDLQQFGRAIAQRM